MALKAKHWGPNKPDLLAMTAHDLLSVPASALVHLSVTPGNSTYFTKGK